MIGLEVYHYQKKRFLIEQTVTNLFALVIIFLALYFIVNQMMPILMSLVLLVALYATVNNFILKVNSEVIVIGDDTISFEAYKKKDTYELSKLQSFKLKEFPSSKKIYVRLVDFDNKKRKYWVHANSFSGGKRLFKKLLDIEHEKHPQSLKARARDQSTINDHHKKSK